jgi:hypothetical protein
VAELGSFGNEPGGFCFLFDDRSRIRSLFFQQLLDRVADSKRIYVFVT